MEQLPRMRGCKIKALSLLIPSPHTLSRRERVVMGQLREDIYLCAASSMKTVSHYAARTKAIYPA